MINRIKILDIWVDAVNKEQALDKVHGFLKFGNRTHFVLASNPEKNFTFPKDPKLHNFIKNADLLLPDGIGIVLAARILAGVRLKRLPGSEFVFDICKLAEKKGYGIFIFGATEEVNKLAVHILKEKYPGLSIKGRSNGYVRETEMHQLIERINHSGAEILFLALGSPKQEKWLATYYPNLKSIRVCQGIGGTLDTIAGNIKRAPRIWQKTALEWLYRLITQPSRMKRQKVLPVFVFAVLIAKVKQLFS